MPANQNPTRYHVRKQTPLVPDALLPIRPKLGALKDWFYFEVLGGNRGILDHGAVHHKWKYDFDKSDLFCQGEIKRANVS